MCIVLPFIMHTITFKLRFEAVQLTQTKSLSLNIVGITNASNKLDNIKTPALIKRHLENGSFLI